MWSFLFSYSVVFFCKSKLAANIFKLQIFALKIAFLASVEISKAVIFFSLHSHWKTSVGTGTCFGRAHVLPGLVRSSALPVVLRTVVLSSLPQPCPQGHLCLNYLSFVFLVFFPSTKLNTWHVVAYHFMIVY